MAKVQSVHNAFNAGEVSEDAWSRPDLQQHAKGCALGLNFVGLVAGPLGRRAGFWDVGGTKSQLEAKLTRPITFRRSIDDAIMLEFGDGYVRFWNADQTPVMDGMDPYEIVSPYATAQLAGLRYCQTGDVMVFTHTDGLAVKSLVRTAATAWAFSDYAFVDGPWRAENVDPAVMVKFHHLGGPAGTAVGSTGTLTANTAIFAAGMVGTYFKLREMPGDHVIDGWAPNSTNANDWANGSLCLSNGRVYQDTSAGAAKQYTGLNPPVHEVGEASDGNIKWTYVHDGSGVLLVTGFTSATVLAVTVVRYLPNLDNGYTSYWAEAAYSAHRGWPRAAPVVREERMIFAANTSEADTLRGSRTAGFKTASVDMKPGLGTGRVVADDAISRKVGDESSRLMWLSSSTYLLAGTRAGEHIVTGGTIDDPLSPQGITARGLSEFGSEDVQPVQAHRNVLHVARGGETLRSIGIGPDQVIASTDLSVLAEHIASRGFAELAWTAQPDNMLWARMADGSLAAFVYHAQEQVFGWTQQEIGNGDWLVEGLAVMPGYGGRDALWITARRQADAGWQRRLMVLSKRSEGLRLDNASFYEGAAVDGVDGLERFEGETITLRADDGAGNFAEYAVEVEDGEAVLPNGLTSSHIIAGQAYLSRFESLPLMLSEGKVRPTQGRITFRGIDCNIGQLGGQLEHVRVERAAAEIAAPAAKRRTFKVTFDGGAEDEPQIVIETQTGNDLTVAMLKVAGET